MGIFSDRLENAIKNNYIKIYYQPVVRTLSGKLCGFVALARWDDPEFGIIGPDLFIPELEQNKIIHKLDCYVIDEICRNYKVQSENGFSMDVIFFSFIEDTIKKYNVPRDLFIIEITETMLQKDDYHINR